MRAALVTLFAALAVGVAVYLFSQPGPSTTPVQSRPAAAAPVTTLGGDAPRPQSRNALDTDVPPGYFDQFRASTDLWSFAESMHRMALEGDDAAQFWLFRALWQCGFFYDQAFDAGPGAPGRQPLSLDEALQRERKSPGLGVARVERLSAQCARLRTPEAAKFGPANGWLEKAAGTGYPQAQIWMAGKLLHDPETNHAGGAGERARARELTYAALRSGDPDVIVQTESVAMLFVRGESAQEKQRWVWTIAGCLEGASCGPDAEWLMPLCANGKRCQPHEGGLDIVRKMVGAQYDELEDEARELNRKLDAGRWDELGF